MTEYRDRVQRQSTDDRVQLTEYRVQSTEYRWMYGQAVNRRTDFPLTPLQEMGIVTTGKRGLSVLAIPEHPLSPPETGVSTTQWGGGG